MTARMKSMESAGAAFWAVPPRRFSSTFSKRGPWSTAPRRGSLLLIISRSEERRVGKECRYLWWMDPLRIEHTHDLRDVALDRRRVELVLDCAGWVGDLKEVNQQ